MGLTYHLLPQMGLGEPMRRAAFWQPCVYGGGQLPHILRLMVRGLWRAAQGGEAVQGLRSAEKWRRWVYGPGRADRGHQRVHVHGHRDPGDTQIRTEGNMGRWFSRFVMAAVVLLVACTRPEPFSGTDITGIDYGRFPVDRPQRRAPVARRFQGKAVVLFFGYTRCPMSASHAVGGGACPESWTKTRAGAGAVRYPGSERDTREVLASTCLPSTRRSWGCTATGGDAEGGQGLQGVLPEAAGQDPDGIPWTTARTYDSIRAGGCGFTSVTAKGERSWPTISSCCSRALLCNARSFLKDDYGQALFDAQQALLFPIPFLALLGFPFVVKFLALGEPYLELDAA